MNENQKIFSNQEAYETVSELRFDENMYKEKRNPYTYRCSGAVYIGWWKGGFRHGLGTMEWKDGTYFDGNWEYGWAEGQGKIIYPNKDSYEGKFCHNKANGKGKFET